MKLLSFRTISLATLVVLAAIGVAVGQTGMDQLVAAAKQEGQLTTIALPHDWCGYGELISSYKTKYGIKVNELNPDAGSGDEIEAIKANKGNKGPQAPDVIDVGLSFGPSAKKEGLLLPHKVATWASIPNDQKDSEGYWYGDYYGVLAFQINADIVKNAPRDWADLLKPEYKNSVALAGDPRTSNQAIQGVLAAGLAMANGNMDQAAEAGLKFFADLNKAGNFVPVIGKVASLAQGATPIIIRWDYNALADRDTLKGNPKVDVVVPRNGVVAGVYVQAISAYRAAPERREAVDGAPLLGRGTGGLAEGLLPSDPLPGPREEQEGAGRPPGQAASGRVLRQGGLPDARAAGEGEGDHHQAVGHRRRRERQVAPTP